jgi:hypothetical protein
VPKDLVMFPALLGRPNTVLNGRLPEITARDILSMVRFGDCSFARRANRPNTRRNALGSRLFKEISGHARVEEQKSRGRLFRAKAAPLQTFDRR